MIHHPKPTTEGPPEKSEAGQPEDRPAHNVEAAITPLVTNTDQRNAGPRRWTGRPHTRLNYVACPWCINCTCGQSESEMLGLEDSGVA